MRKRARQGCRSVPKGSDEIRLAWRQSTPLHPSRQPYPPYAFDPTAQIHSFTHTTRSLRRMRREWPGALLARRTRTLRRMRGGRQPSFLLAEPPRYSGGRSMRAVKDGLPTPSGECEKSEGPRSTAAPRPTWVPSQEQKSKRAWKDLLDRCCSFDARNQGSIRHSFLTRLVSPACLAHLASLR